MYGRCDSNSLCSRSFTHGVKLCTGGALSTMCVQGARSATIWVFGHSRTHTLVLWASLFFDSRF